MNRHFSHSIVHTRDGNALAHIAGTDDSACVGAAFANDLFCLYIETDFVN